MTLANRTLMIGQDSQGKFRALPLEESEGKTVIPVTLSLESPLNVKVLNTTDEPVISNTAKVGGADVTMVLDTVCDLPLQGIANYEAVSYYYDDGYCHSLAQGKVIENAYTDLSTTKSWKAKKLKAFSDEFFLQIYVESGSNVDFTAELKSSVGLLSANHTVSIGSLSVTGKNTGDSFILTFSKNPDTATNKKIDNRIPLPSFELTATANADLIILLGSM